MKKNYLLAVVIGGVFIALMVLLALGLRNNPDDLDFVTKGRKIPAIELPLLLSDKTLNTADVKLNKPYYLVNFFGSWCPSCYQEHAFLLSLGKKVPLYGVNWKDKRADGQQFIRAMGNPFRHIWADSNSRLAIELGVSGAPETYLIAADGTIVHRYAGVMTAKVWAKEFQPKIQALE